MLVNPLARDSQTALGGLWVRFRKAVARWKRTEVSAVAAQARAQIRVQRWLRWGITAI